MRYLKLKVRQNRWTAANYCRYKLPKVILCERKNCGCSIDEFARRRLLQLPTGYRNSYACASVHEKDRTKPFLHRKQLEFRSLEKSPVSGNYFHDIVEGNKSFMALIALR